MAPQAHHVDKLVKAGLEGFAIIDEAYGRKKKSAGSRVHTTTEAYDHHQYYNYNNQQQYVYWGPQVITVREQVLSSNEAAQFYGGKSIVDYSIRKPNRGVY